MAKATLENKVINSKSVSIIWRSDFNFTDEILRSHENVWSDDLISCKCIQLFDREFPATQTTDNTPWVQYKRSETITAFPWHRRLLRHNKVERKEINYWPTLTERNRHKTQQYFQQNTNHTGRYSQNSQLGFVSSFLSSFKRSSWTFYTVVFMLSIS